MLETLEELGDDAERAQARRNSHIAGISVRARKLWTAPEAPNLAEEVADVADVNYSDTCGRVILDCGCRRSMAGKPCHHEARHRLAELGLPVEVPCDDNFRFAMAV